MTDWLPLGFVLAAGTYGTLWLTLDAVERGLGAATVRARRALWVSAAATLLLLLVYVAAGEAWLPY